MSRLKLHAKRELSYDPQTSGIVWTLCMAHVEPSRIAAFTPEGVSCKKCLASLQFREEEAKAWSLRQATEERYIKRLDAR